MPVLNLLARTFAVAAVSACLLAACAKKEEQAASATDSTQASEALAQESTATSDAAGAPAPQPMGLVITDLKAGTGPAIEKGQQAVVHYTGWLYSESAPDTKGTKFDSSVDRGEPFSFPLGGGRVIRGWEEGVLGMQVGGQRRLIIPPDMAYGERGAGGVIPPNATLVFDVELLQIR
jgi:FKBP-type peptidyl-prolyl cis-trans isomerase FkpA